MNTAGKPYVTAALPAGTGARDFGLRTRHIRRTLHIQHT